MSVLTILIMLTIGHLIISILSYGYYRKNRENALKLFIVAQVLLCLAYLAITYRAISPNAINIILGNSLLVLALGIQSAVLLMNLDAWDNKVSRVYIWGLVSIMSIFYLYVFFGDKESIRIFIITFAAISVNLYPVYKLFFEKKSTFFRKILGITLLGAVLAFSLRIINSINPGVDMMMLGTNISNMLTFIALYILMLVNGLGLILVVKENDDAKLLFSATRDSLTGLYNIGLFTEECNKQIELHIRKKLPLVLLLMDLDHFKNINDSYGHNVGNKVLKHFANTISAGLRTYDLFGRVGGDEFAVMLPNTEFDCGCKIAERLRSEIELTSIDSIEFTVSIGLYAIIPDANTDYEGILKAADNELYLVKMAGRNSVGFHIAPL